MENIFPDLFEMVLWTKILLFQKERVVLLVISSAHAFFWQSSSSRFFTVMSENCCVEVNSLELQD